MKHDDDEYADTSNVAVHVDLTELETEFDAAEDRFHHDCDLMPVSHSRWGDEPIYRRGRKRR